MIRAKLQIFTGSAWLEYQVYNSVTFDKRKDGQLCTANCLIITAAGVRFAPQRKARLTISDGSVDETADYFAYFKTQKRAANYWLQSVTLISVARRAQIELIDGLRVIQNDSDVLTLYDTLSKLCNTTPLRLTVQTNKYHITTNEEIVTVLKSIPSPEFAWSCRTLFWECLKEIGATMGGYIPDLSFTNLNYPSDEYTISFVNTSKITKTVNELNYKSYSYEIEESEVCSEVDSDIANIISTDQETASTVFPSQNSFISPRTEEVRLTTDNCKLILPTTIEKIVKVTLDITNIEYRGSTDTAGTPLSSLLETDTIDITEYVLERKRYEATPTWSPYGNDFFYKGNKWKNNTVYWIEGTNEIVLSTGTWNIRYGTTGWKSKQAIIGTICSVTSDLLRETGHNNPTAYAESIMLSDNDIRNMRFRVEYIPVDSSTKLRAAKQDKCDYEGVQIYNQRAEKVDSEMLSADLKKSVNQRGVEYFKTVDFYSNLSDILPLGTQYTEGVNNYEIVANEYELTNKQSIKVGHYWSKNWAMLSPRLMQSKEYRNTNIPTDVLERNLYYEDFCIISTTPRRQTGDVGLEAIITTGGYEALRRLWELSDSEAICEVNNYAIYRENGDAGVVSSCSSFAVANSIVFCGKVKNNLSIGIALGDEWECHEVVYASDDGVMKTALLQFGFTMSKLNNYSLPYCNRGEDDYQNVIATTAVEGLFYIDKSSAEKTNFTYQLHFVTDTPTIVVGEGMASLSPLIKGADGTENLRFWRLNAHLSKSATVLTSYDGAYDTVTATNINDYLTVTQNGENAGYWVLFKVSRYADYKGWAVSDEKNRLILACNETPADKKIYFNFSHKFHSEA